MQNDTGCLTHSHKHTHTPASERRWRKKWEVLGGCESQVRECVYRCLKMRAPGVLIGRGRWVRDVRLVVCYVRGRMAGEKEGSVKNRECENDTDGLQRRRWRGGEKKKAFWIGERSWARGLLEWLNIKTEQLINQSSKDLFLFNCTSRLILNVHYSLIRNTWLKLMEADTPPGLLTLMCVGWTK